MRRFKQQVSDEECIEILKTTKRGVLSVIGADINQCQVQNEPDILTSFFRIIIKYIRFRIIPQSVAKGAAKPILVRLALG